MDSYRLQDERDIKDLQSFLDGFRFSISSLSSETYGADPRQYELTADDTNDGVRFFALDDGRVAAAGSFLRNASGLTDPNAILVSSTWGNYEDWDFDRLAFFLDSRKDTKR
jgi:hypothetical protein